MATKSKTNSKRVGKNMPKKSSFKPSLKTRLGSLVLENPVMTASGTFGYGLEFAPYMKLNSLGAIVVKGLSLKPREGNPGPRIVETPSGMLNAIGLQNIGVDAFIKDKLPLLRKYKTKIIANIFGETVREYAEIARRLDGRRGIAAVEINISCPNVKHGGLAFGVDPRMAARVVRAVRKATTKHIMTKLSPNVTDIKVMARAVEAAGTDSISLINTITGMVVDIDKRRPVLAMSRGGLSGPAIRPIAVRMVNDVSSVVQVPIVGIGGIVTGADALEFIMAGASAVQIGTASFISPGRSGKVASEISAYMKQNKVKRVSSLVGCF
jgi:dihydroorotate dehydrogenase (NAD+) catalytic subunit